MDKTNIAVLGATGSIGQQTLDVVRAYPDRFRVIGLTAGSNGDVLAKQIAEFQPRFVHCQSRIPHIPDVACEILAPEEIARHPEVAIVVIASSGKSGLLPSLAAAQAGKCIALANKESLVSAGEIVMAEVRSTGAELRPVDSEHSAIWQCLQGEIRPVSRLILTASGGPFLYLSPEKRDMVTVEQALGHPTWQMGKKVTIDSATLMNKGLEVIEAHWLFDMPYDNIDVLIHRDSIVHSLVEFVDGSVKAQLSYPDMRLPIQYALTYPQRLENKSLPGLDWDRITRLTFEKPDPEDFPCLKLAIEAGRSGGTYPAVLCAADEVAVELFLSRQIDFTAIPRLVEQCLAAHQPVSHPTLGDILEADAWAREKVTLLASGACQP